MFEAFGFRMLVLLVIFLTFALGIVGALAGWVAVLVDKSRASRTKVPYALYTLTLFVLVQIASQFFIRHLTHYVVVVWSFFLPSGLACVAAWLIARKASGPATKVPYALYTLTLFVLFQFAGLLAVQTLPPDLTLRPIFGTSMVQFVWRFVLLTGFALCAVTGLLTWKASGPATLILRSTSALLLTTWGLGLLCYVTGN